NRILKRYDEYSIRVDYPARPAGYQPHQQAARMIETTSRGPARSAPDPRKRGHTAWTVMYLPETAVLVHSTPGSGDLFDPNNIDRTVAALITSQDETRGFRWWRN